MIRSLCVSLLVLVTITGCSKVKSVDVLNFVLPSNHYTRETVHFAKGPRLTMDIYQPSTATDKPVVIFIYGGAWKMGESSEYKFIAHALTGLGYPVIIPNYRLYPSVTFPTFVNDVALAIAYAETHAAHLSVDINKHGYVLMGHSSGAHTAALLATQESFLRNNGVTHKPIGLIGLSGPYDLPLDDPEVEPVFGGAPAENVNPLLNVNQRMPPTLLLHGADDDRVIPKHSNDFAAEIEKQSVAVTLRIYSGVDHVKIVASIAAPLRFMGDSYDDIAHFLSSLERHNDTASTPTTPMSKIQRTDQTTSTTTTATIMDTQ